MRSVTYKKYIEYSFLRYALSIIVILFIMMIAFLSFNFKVLEHYENKKNTLKLLQVLEKQFLSYNLALENLSKDTEIINLVSGSSNSHPSEVNRTLYNFVNAQDLKANFVLLDKDFNIISSNLFESNKELFLESRVLEKVSAAPLNNTYITPSRLNYDYEQESSLIFAHAVMNGKEKVGYLFFDVLSKDIENLFMRSPIDSIVLTDRYDHIIFYTGKKSVDLTLKYPGDKYMNTFSKNGEIDINGTKYQGQINTFIDGQFTLYTMVSKEIQRRSFYYGLWFIILSAFIMLFMIPYITRRISEKNVSAIEEMIGSITQMSHGKKVEHPVVFEEFNKLLSSFEMVLAEKEALIKNNSELSERKRIMEIKQLEEQFNPHFLFNILETLKYQIMIDKDKAVEMVLAFAGLMRYSIYYGSTVVPLGTDIEYINDYLMLQKLRYNRRLTYSIDIPDELQECLIPKLLLQPIVENSLAHGLVDVIHITIRAECSADMLIISVEDNGKGIDSQNLQLLRESLEKDSIYKEHIGLYNSHRVVKLLYGNRYGLEINSCHGTLITVRLPFVLESEDE
ncbi:histidine kinase [Lachnoanaerobaculum sp. Marseille-Q4761]|uniref:sensor histidine kinase n=1 Tax=Lachnoanaerobaculum sp. Marseille-Q4761 TaxID=2819511 RepID=UPI001AA179E2|nr:histidine kinase [Lachnoanaerobaculum sp. Marseille-Q4761]MBO1870026.1 histidine kinase [Lachnoanaerobaculum sp. Marseille-Q4761]